MTEYLSSHQLKELKEAHRLERDTRYSDRIRAILYLSMGMGYGEVAEILFCDERSIRRYEERYFRGGLECLLGDGRGGSEAKLSDAQVEDLRKELKKKVYRTTKAIKSLIFEKFSVEYSLSAVYALLMRMGFVYKKPKVIPSKGDREAQIAFAETVEKTLDSMGENDAMYYVDGVHPQYATSVTYGWIEKGTDVEFSAQTGRKRVNINGALNARTNEIIVDEQPTLNAQAFIALIKRLEQINDSAEVIYIILDNARYYRNKLVLEYVKTSRVKLLFLPPYSPNLNLIERVWKFLKNHLLYNRYFDSFDSFKTEVLDFLEAAHINFSEELESLLARNFHFYQAKAT